MSEDAAERPDPTQIGDVSAPPFAVPPKPETLFAQRAERLRRLAQGHDLALYLNFVADISKAQHESLSGLSEVAPPSPDELARARQFAMPPLDRGRFEPVPAFDASLERFLKIAGQIAMPSSACEALQRVSTADAARRLLIAHNVLAEAIPLDMLAEHVFVAAALQIHFSRLSQRLDPSALVPVGDGACPACGGAPGVSMIVGWHGSHGARYCACSLCQTLWNYVRIRCVACGSTKGISYREIEGGNGAVKAECCSECNSYLKIFHQTIDPAVDPVADDIATTGLDLLVREEGLRRAGFNYFLIGY
jgi:FdhE protein